jgi:tail tube protein gp19
MNTVTRDDRIKAYAGGRFALELDQRQPAGWIGSIDGGHFKSQAVSSMVGADRYVTRYAGKPTYDDITISVGAAMSPPFWAWVQASLDGEPQRRNGAIVGYDFDLCERTRRTFAAALISEIQFPALDSTSKNPANISIKMSPEHIQYDKANGTKLSPSQAKDEGTKQKMWLSNNFRFTLDRFKGDESLHNAKVESFTVKQNIIQNPIGYELETRKEVGRLELPNLVVSFPESLAHGWFDWFNTAVVQGDRGKQYTTGAIHYLSQDMRTELMRIDFDGVSLLSLDIDKLEAGREAIAQVKATLNIEGIKLSTGQGTVSK